MKLTFNLCIIIVAMVYSCNDLKTSQYNIGKNNFDEGWKFRKDSLVGAESLFLSDSGWITVDLPHDWSINDVDKTSDPEAIGPFSKKSEGKFSTGHVVGGTGWYRKHFTLGSKTKGKNVKLLFDGVYMVSEVWVNGKKAGTHYYGYTPFYFDITSYLNKTGEENLVAVKVMNKGKNSRWYSGSGIYRHVWLLVEEKINIPVWGTFITTPEVSEEKAKVQISTKLQNQKDENANLVLKTMILDKNKNQVVLLSKDTLIQKSADIEIKQETLIQNPDLWSCETPDLYTVVQEVEVDGNIIDKKESNFGIRKLEFSPEKGFLLNGVETHLYGGCMHHDNGILGSATFDRAEERRVENMKANGFNAIRTSHNPPSSQFLDACDRLGMLVIDEAFDMWEHPKNPEDYHLYFKENAKKDLESMILRDRNHPSIIIWSIGNEIYERADSNGVRIGNYLKKIVTDLDQTRPVTAAVCFFWDHPDYTWKNSAPAFSILDVQGYNYTWKEYTNDARQFPNRIMMGTESVPFEAYENWNEVETKPYVIGDFVWTGMDYLGESGIGHSYTDTSGAHFSMPWPWFNAWCGDIDIIGNKKLQSYFRDVVWHRSKIEMAVHYPLAEGVEEKISYWGWPDEYQSWTWSGSEGKKMKVNVYSRSEKVRLELNGKLIGEKSITEKDKLTATFEVPYEAGELKASAIENGKVVAEKSFKTAGMPAKIKLIAEKQSIKAGKGNIAYFRVEILDKDGNSVPLAKVPVKFTINGEATLLAAGTACPNCMESFTDNEFTTFDGFGQIIIRSNGKVGSVKLEAISEGLEKGNCEITAE
ncbi:MAG: glycoside hydrolase family 2 TIM barrel-domain containing protein [Bacteroidales bacterium]